MTSIHTQIPPEQLSLPRRARQFPFRWANEREREDVRREADTILRQWQNAIYKTAKRYARNRRDRSEVEDLAAELMRFIWECVLPRFNAWTHPTAKPSTLIVVAIRRAAITFTKPKAMQKQLDYVPDELLDGNLHARDQGLDRRIEEFSEIVMSMPERFLCERDHREFTALLTGAPGNDSAKRRGIAAASVSRHRAQIMERIIECFDELGELQTYSPLDTALDADHVGDGTGIGHGGGAPQGSATADISRRHGSEDAE